MRSQLVDSANGNCALDQHAGEGPCMPYSARVFPNYPNSVYVTQRSMYSMPRDVVRAFLGGGGMTTVATCPEVATGRVVIPPMQDTRLFPRHDVSLCNIMGMGADYVYVPFVNRLYILGDPVGIPATIILSVLIVFMMVVMGHNLQVRAQICIKMAVVLHFQ